MKVFFRVFILSLSLGLSSCALLFFKNPELKVESVELERVDSKDLLLNVKLHVKNPNSFNLEISQIDYKIIINESAVADSSVTKKYEIPKEGETTLTLPVKFSTTDLIGSALEILVSKKFSYKMAGVIRHKGMRVPFSSEGDLRKKVFQ
ncbi:MAG: LEA type 2 family protein [Pseudomonadota bacterium]|nr:LEA type 2 family protein [Pseudomonadota bacterium]